MRLPRECYQMEEQLAQHLPVLRPAQRRGLALWVYGAVLAQSACQNAVVSALLAVGRFHTVRQYLREWLYDGADKAAPCQAQVEVEQCFEPLLRWLLGWWQGRELALAVDATLHGQRVAALVVSVLYRGSAIPVAWHILPANRKGAWLRPLGRLLRQLRPAIPREMQVVVFADRGLWSPRLWRTIRAGGWHPVLRVRQASAFQPFGGPRQPAASLVRAPGEGWVGRGVLFQARHRQRVGTLVVVWGVGHREPWVVVTDLAPARVGLCWYGLRMWIECGFRALKSVGWQWQHTRRTDPARVARHWLVLAVATLWVVAYGTRSEDAQTQGVPPARLRTPRDPPPPSKRSLSVFRQGVLWFARQLLQGRVWRSLWLLPEPWPQPPPHLQITYGPP